MNTEETKSWGCLGLRCRVGAAVAATTTCTSSSPRMLMPFGRRILPRLFHAKGCLFVCVGESGVSLRSAPTRDSWDPRLYRNLSTYPLCCARARTRLSLSQLDPCQTVIIGSDREETANKVPINYRKSISLRAAWRVFRGFAMRMSEKFFVLLYFALFISQSKICVPCLNIYI